MENELLPELDSKMSLGDINARLAELEYDFQKMLARAADDGDYEAYTEKFRAIAEEIAGLKEKRSVIAAHRTGNKTDHRIRYAVDFFENSSSDLTEWDDFLMRQLIDWVKILSTEEILVCLRGGIEIRQKMG